MRELNVMLALGAFAVALMLFDLSLKLSDISASLAILAGR